MQPDLFNALVHHIHAETDRHGEAHFPCPSCGHESTPRDPHCSFSVRGWKCFSCGDGGSLSKLAKMVNLNTSDYQPIAYSPKPIERRPATWLSDAERLVTQYEVHPQRVELWQQYKPVSYTNIVKRRLGVGILPLSKCHHERLILPIIDGTMIVGLRGRSMGCDCGKWLAPGGTQISMYPMYNADSLKPGCVTWIVENPIDALLITQTTEFIGVATYSVAYWQETWTQTLQAAKPSMTIVAYDNDLSGNGGAARRESMLKDWSAKHPGLKPIEPAGPKLANRLNQANVSTTLFDWGNMLVKDIGVLIGSPV